LRLIGHFAYLDPNMGSVVFQSIVGVVAGVGVFGRKLFSGLGQKVKGIFSRSESSKSLEK
jgi:hypothetical protein